MSRVLVVDDDADILEALAGALEDRHQHQISTAKNGREALELLKTDPFDALIVDLIMPVMDGETLLETMRKAGIDLPVVLASGSHDVTELARRFGVEYVTKPYDVTLLERKLARMVATQSESKR